MKNIQKSLNIDSESVFIKKAMSYDLLSREDEESIVSRWKNGDMKALDRLISAYMRLAISMASKYKNYGIPLGDLIQEANLGLMTAASKFDLEKGVRFGTYASWWIRSHLQDYILHNWSIVRTGTTSGHKSLFFNLRRIKAEIEREFPDLNSEQKTRLIADRLNVKPEEVAYMEARITSDSSLNEHVGEETEFMDLLIDHSPTPEEIVQEKIDQQFTKQLLDTALKGLNEREKQIITSRWLSEESQTLDMIGKNLEISKERVRQLEHRAMGKIKQSISKNLKDDSGVLF